MVENSLIVHMFPCLSDNYGYLIHDLETGLTATIDTPDGDEINRQLAGNIHRVDGVNGQFHRLVG